MPPMLVAAEVSKFERFKDDSERHPLNISSNDVAFGVEKDETLSWTRLEHPSNINCISSTSLVSKFDKSMFVSD